MIASTESKIGLVIRWIVGLRVPTIVRRKQWRRSLPAGEIRIVAPEGRRSAQQAVEVGAQECGKDLGNAATIATLAEQTRRHRGQASQLVGARGEQAHWDVARD